MSRVKRLRELKSKSCPVPNFRAKLWTMRIQNEITDHSTFQLPRVDDTESCSGEMQYEDELVISGTYVEALFPSIRDIESARVVRETVIESDASIGNFDCKAALKYLYIVGGPAHLRESGLGENIQGGWGKDKICCL